MGCSQSVEAVSKGSDGTSGTGTPRGDMGAGEGSKLTENLLVERKKDYHEDYSIVKQVGQGSISSIFLVRKDKSSGALEPEEAAPGIPAVIDYDYGGGSSEGVKGLPNDGYEYYALKEIDMDLVEPESLGEMKNEIRVLKRLDHPNIIRAYELYEEGTEHISVIMEYCAGGDLNSRGPYNESQVKKIIARITEAVTYLHKRGIMHRDLTFENILFESDAVDADIKIIDFGLAQKYKKGDRFKGSVGTMYTMSPEVIRGQYNYQADLWSIGVITFQLLAGEPPFQGEDMHETTQKILKADYGSNSKAWKSMSPEARDFIKRLLVVDPKSRYTADQALKDPWLAKHTQKTSRDLSVDSLDDLSRSICGDIMQTSEFRKLALHTVARRAQTPEIVHLREAFHAIDCDHDGCITIEDLRRGLDGHFAERDIEAWFKHADVYETGSICYTEFLAAALEAHDEIRPERIEEAFRIFDRDEKGYITTKDLCAVIGLPANSDYIRQLMDEADVDQSGKIEFEEFRDLITVAL